MAKIFNKIRKRLMSEKKFIGYISYAAGEIILVVIGILIALQVDNLVQKAKDTKEANAFESRLLTEVEANIQLLTFKVSQLNDRSQLASGILAMVGPDYKNKSQSHLDSLLVGVLHFNNVRLGNGALNEGIGNGELDLIQSDSLRSELYELPVHIAALKVNEELLNNNFYNTVVPYLNSNYARRNIDAFSSQYEEVLGGSKISVKDPLKILNQLEFENHIRNLLYHNLSLKDNYNGLRERYTKFAVVLKKELAKNKN